MPAARGSRSMRYTMKLKRKAKRAAAPKKATSAIGVTVGARRNAKKLANLRRGAVQTAANS
ncbi:MAG: hypothetical protein ACK5JT_11660 [Hyphomicrobiaceae bacterium]